MVWHFVSENFKIDTIGWLWNSQLYLLFYLFSSVVCCMGIWTAFSSGHGCCCVSQFFFLGGHWTVMQKIHCQKYVSLCIKEAVEWVDRCWPKGMTHWLVTFSQHGIPGTFVSVCRPCNNRPPDNMCITDHPTPQWPSNR